MRILITGSNGLLGQKIVNQLNKTELPFVASSLGENRNSLCHPSNYQSLDITDNSEIQKLINTFKPTHIINTAAVTNVDYCEDNVDLCQSINVNAVNSMFEMSILANIHFIQLSTDFVFDGKNGPYKESDQTNPLSIYAKSKKDSENILTKSKYNNWSILRTIIVYGEGQNLSRSNIVLWAKSALAKGQKLTIVDDQFRAPTWADDLAWACIQSAKLYAKGIFHICGPQTFSIYDLVCQIADFYGFDKNLIKPIQSNTLNQAAKRPPKTGFIITKAKNELNYSPISFKDSLKFIS